MTLHFKTFFFISHFYIQRKKRKQYTVNWIFWMLESFPWKLKRFMMMMMMSTTWFPSSTVYWPTTEKKTEKYYLLWSHTHTLTSCLFRYLFSLFVHRSTQIIIIIIIILVKMIYFRYIWFENFLRMKKKRKKRK